jgi:hypothetical protein
MTTYVSVPNAHRMIRQHGVIDAWTARHGQVVIELDTDAGGGEGYLQIGAKQDAHLLNELREWGCFFPELGDAPLDS